MQQHSDERAFTLIEILVVMTLIAILVGIGVPAFTSVMEQARKTQAKNEEQQIIAAVNAFYTEYGKYPLVTADTTLTGPSNGDLFYTLRAVPSGANGANAINTRAIVFIQPPVSKDQNKPRSGISTTTGIWYDPWGSPYNVMIDGDYDNQLANPYADAPPPGGTPLYFGVIVWSFGKNGVLGGGPAAAGFSSSEGGSANKFSGSGDVISWQ
ncbi:MAG TPA: prepilin-type N-terminal cleavage/methylation domain-containing protein [Candidatus Udaeobacter sp.]